MNGEQATGHKPRLWVTRQAYAEVVRAVALGRDGDVEFGGSLMVLTGGDEPVVVYAVPTGPNAIQAPASLVTDAAFQNQALAAVGRRYPALRYGGDWHIHPMWLPHLSSTDRRTAREILAGREARRRPAGVAAGHRAAYG